MAYGDPLDPDGATPAAPAAPNRLDRGFAEALAGGQRALDYTQGHGPVSFGTAGDSRQSGPS